MGVAGFVAALVATYLMWKLLISVKFVLDRYAETGPFNFVVDGEWRVWCCQRAVLHLMINEYSLHTEA